MKTKLYVGATIGVLGILIFIACGRGPILTPSGTEDGKTPADQAKALTDQGFGDDESAAQQEQAAGPGQNQTLSPEKVQSLNTMVAVLVTYANPNMTLEQLYAYLEASGRAPQVAHEKQELIEDMYHVRINNHLVGTRYFKARYVEDHDGHGWPVVQGMSFELQPSEDSMKLAIDAVKESFSNLGAVLYQDDFSTQWALPGGYSVSVTKLQPVNLEGNAYTQADIGTVKVTVEEIPHGH